MIISIIGADGSGKSTQTRRLATFLRRRGYRVRVIDKWGVLDAAENTECRFINSDRADIAACIAQMPSISRAYFLFWMMGISLKPILEEEGDLGTVFLIDGYWHKHAASEIVLGQREEFICALVSPFPAANLTILLDAPVAVAAARKVGNYSVYECGLDQSRSRIAFEAHQGRIRAHLTAMGRASGWHMVDATDGVAAVERRLRALVEGAIAEHSRAADDREPRARTVVHSAATVRRPAR